MQVDLPAPSGTLNWRGLLGFSSPVFPFAGQEIAFKIFLPIYLAQTTHFSLRVIAVIFLVFRVWDTLNDPLIGWISDHWRWGHRRLVPMVLGAPLAIGGLGLVMFSPSTLSPLGMGLALIVAALGWTLVNVPHGAWALEIGPDPRLCTRVFASRQLIGLIALPFFVLGPSVLEQLYGTNNRRDAAIIATIIITSLPASLLWLRAAIPVGWRRLRPPVAPVSLATLRAVFFERQSLFLLALFACLGVHAEIKDGLILFWVRDSLHLPTWGWSIVLFQALSGAAAVPLWVRLQARCGTLPTFRISLAATAVATLGFAVVPAGSVGWLAGFILLQGLMAGSSFTMLRVMLGEHAARLETSFGVNLAGTFYSGFHLAFNLAVALTLPAALEVLARMGFDGRAGAHAGHAPLGLLAHYDPVAWLIAGAGSLALVLASCLAGFAARGPSA